MAVSPPWYVQRRHRTALLCSGDVLPNFEARTSAPAQPSNDRIGFQGELK